VHSVVEAWKLVTLTAPKNCFVKCCSQLDHVCSNGDNATNLVKTNKQTRPEKESEQEEDEEVAEYTVTFLDALKALEVARQYMFQFDM
jgi:hypothetical protein